MPPGAAPARQTPEIAASWTIDIPIASPGLDQPPSPTMCSA